jgi:ABC-type multidrug transport system fused ATPase/permease subunit
LKAGRIIERGTHADLLSLDGMYRRMWEFQTSGGLRPA